jgi:hypothetical protein
MVVTTFFRVPRMCTGGVREQLRQHQQTSEFSHFYPQVAHDLS